MDFRECEWTGKELPRKEKELAALERGIHALSQAAEALNRDIRAKQEEITIAAEKSRIQTNDRLLRALLEAQNNGELDGILGRYASNGHPFNARD